MASDRRVFGGIRSITAVFVAVVIAVSACATTVPSQNPGASTAASAAPAAAASAAPSAALARTFKVGWSVAYFDHPVYQLMMKGAREMAAKRGIELIFTDGKRDAAVQASDIDNFLAQKVDAIILTPNVSDPLIPSVKKINDAGVPFVVADRRMFKQGTDIKWDALVGWCIVCSGDVGGKQAVQALTQPDGSVKGNLVVIEGTAGAGSTIDRGDAFYKVISQYPGIKIIHKVDGDFDRAKAQTVTENTLQRFPKGQIDAMYFMADEMLFGGIQAIKAANRLGEFKIISVDGNKQALDMLRAGEIDYDGIFFPQDQGAIAINVVADMLEGKTPVWAKQCWEGRCAELDTFEGHPWVKPGFFGIDKTNMNEPQNVGW